MNPILRISTVALAVLAAGAPAAQAASQTTERVSLSSTGAQLDDESTSPVISADGRWVAFTTVSDKAVPDDTNGRRDVFLRDRRTGVTRRISVGSDGRQADGGSSSPSMSNDGRYVAFISSASNLGAQGAPMFLTHASLLDRASGALKVLDVRADGTAGNGFAS